MMKKKNNNAFNDNTKVYTPKNIVPRNDTLIITDNFTEVDGRVYNKSDENAAEARQRVDDIRL